MYLCFFVHTILSMIKTIRALMLFHGRRLKMKALILLLTTSILNSNAYASKDNFFDKLNPKRPDIEKILKEVDADYESTTGKSAHLEIDPLEELFPSCYRNSCMVWADGVIQLPIWINTPTEESMIVTLQPSILTVITTV